MPSSVTHHCPSCGYDSLVIATLVTSTGNPCCQQVLPLFHYCLLSVLLLLPRGSIPWAHPTSRTMKSIKCLCLCSLFSFHSAFFLSFFFSFSFSRRYFLSVVVPILVAHGERTDPSKCGSVACQRPRRGRKCKTICLSSFLDRRLSSTRPKIQFPIWRMAKPLT
jgi:hypothetical protein